MSEKELQHPLPQSSWGKIRHTLLGPARDLHDPEIGHKISLIAFLAWVGLGADGLSSSAYGPEEAYRALGSHTYLALMLVLATAGTVIIISYTYSKIIEHFPTGGGGYAVATQLLGRPAGLVSGCALLVDYVLTITVSIAGGGDALFSLLPISYGRFKIPLEYGAIVILILLNLRGVKESVKALIPIFLTFIATHFILIGGGMVFHALDFPAVSRTVESGYHEGLGQLGWFGLLLIFFRAYSMGGGTYTGIEAVSNGVGILRDPKVETGKRTMFYMALSLAATAGGLLLCYMLVKIEPVPGQTFNAVLASRLAGSISIFDLPVGQWFVVLTIISEAILLLVAAQTGFIGGPRVMANMANDSWLPRRFAALSDRLTMQDGILLMGVAAALLLAYAHGRIQILVVMYSINVFLTFSLSQMGMMRFWVRGKKKQRHWGRNLLLHTGGFILCTSILIVMLLEKFTEGAWMTSVITCACIAVCFAIRRHYHGVRDRIIEINSVFADVAHDVDPNTAELAIDSKEATAVILVNGFGGMGIHIFLTVFRLFPETFKNVFFISVGVIDSALFNDSHQVDAVESETRDALEKYVKLAHSMGIPARSAYRIGIDVVNEASELCVEVAKKYSRTTFFAGELIFNQPKWYHHLLHNYTPNAIQNKIRFAGLTMMILPILDERARLAPTLS